MTRPMDLLLAELDRRGVGSRQTAKGSWVLSRDGTIIAIGGEPETESGWIDLINQLRRAGWVSPEED
ncbi:hypothetical protein [Streptomyces sp. NBC_00829]|uniref:hypothetical protein n=1 Tax=Streptomyces sp. NBC_00829 TaxID=2903679 RepID=UPI003866D294|nr:hypothetical protein OG293_00300 [Streptomyces sp. NBC_00829]WTB19057.1 hypothetical protein OG293_39235 [Streptomyces sp. NBC_00829]